MAPVPLIGDATTAPFLESRAGITVRMAPEPEGWEEIRCVDGVCHGYRGVGREAYLGQISLHTAGAARRYRGIVPLWNTENELNWTPIHVLVAGWRLGRAWFDTAFLGNLLQTLFEAVHIGAGDEALATMNFNVHDPFWRSRLAEWEGFMDVVGLGAYPNYLFSRPVLSALLFDALDKAMAETAKPVMVMETGYPSGPSERRYDQTLQADYLAETAAGTRARGALGYLWYRLDDPYDPDSQDPIQAVEIYWGLVDRDGEPKPSYHRYQGMLLSTGQAAMAGASSPP